MKTRLVLAAAVLLACGAAHAGGRVGISLNFGFPAYGTFYGPLPYGAVSIGGGRSWGHDRPWRHGGYGYWSPGYVLVPPPVAYYAAPAPAEPPVPSVGPTRPDPVIYPRNGQDANQTEYDRQQCNRWATTQPAAVADAAVFQRAVEACMDGRGYSMR